MIENTIQDLIEAYYIVLLQTERYKVYKKMMEVSKDRLDAEEERRELGGSVTYEVLKSKNLYLNDQYNLLNQQHLVAPSY
jgi:outer membrane protein TolC